MSGPRRSPLNKDRSVEMSPKKQCIRFRVVEISPQEVHYRRCDATTELQVGLRRPSSILDAPSLSVRSPKVASKQKQGLSKVISSKKHNSMNSDATAILAKSAR